MGVTSKQIFDQVLVGDGCWEWTGQREVLGYGYIEIDGKRPKAHRLVYEMLIGPIPDDLEIDHLCRNRGCVRPAHLEPVVHAENMRRAKPYWPRKTHCPQGHPYDDANTYVVPRNGKRVCRTCRNDRKRAR